MGKIKSRLLLGIVSLALGLTSCSTSRLAQCQEMAEVIDEAHVFKEEFDAEINSLTTTVARTESLEDVQSAASEYIATVDKAAAYIVNMNESLNTLEFSDEQIATYRDRYVEVMQNIRQEFTAASKAMSLVAQAETADAVRDQLDEFQAQVSKAFSNIQEHSMEEATLVNEINDYCTADESDSSAE